MPTKIIPQRAKEPPCCGGSFLRSEIILGSGTVSPCVPTTTEMVTNGTFTGGFAGWTFIDIGNGQAAYFFATDRLNYDDGTLISDGYFQAINLDSTKNYTLSYDKIDTGVDPPPSVAIVLQSADGKTTFDNVSIVNGSRSVQLTDIFWNPGPSSQFATYGLGPTDYGILLFFDTNGAPFGGGYIDNISLTFEECI